MKNVRIATIVITAFLFFTALPANLQAREKGEKVLFENTFDVNTNAELEIIQEFGNVNCSNWDKQVIAVKITAEWEGGNASAIQKMLDRIEIDVTGDRDGVSIFCKPGKQSSNNSVNLTLNVEVFMPRSVSLQLKQKFGSAFIEALDGPANVSSEYGSLQIMELNNPENKLKLAFGNGAVKHLTAGSVKISYSEFSIETAADISLRSEFSDITISQKIRSLSLELQGGSLTLHQVADLKLEAQYSNAEIDKLTHSLLLESSYGSASIGYVSPDFKTIRIENEFGSVNLSIDAEASYRFEAESEFGEIDFPERNANLSYKKTTSTGSYYKGVIGKSEPISEVIIESRYGGVTISN